MRLHAEPDRGAFDSDQQLIDFVREQLWDLDEAEDIEILETAVYKNTLT